MSFTTAAAAAEGPATTAPEDIDWEMLDKCRFFVLGAVLFSGVSAALYPAVVLKTRQQCSPFPLPCARAAAAILRLDGPRGFYRGFTTSLAGTIPARALYMAALEVTKSSVGSAASRVGVPEPAAAAAASAAAGISAAVAAQVVWTPVDVISQRLMVQGSPAPETKSRYGGGVDAFRKIMVSDGLRGLYKGFGMSILTYAPSNAVWWASYFISRRIIGGGGVQPDVKAAAVVVQGASAALAGGAACIVTMPLDTIKTRLQVMEDSGGVGDRKAPAGASIGRMVKALIKEGGWGACYRGFGPRCAAMSMSSTTMITTYEFLKRLSAKNPESSAAATI